jgi:dephospho-CoA kinase
MPLVIGVTGSIATGKSTVCRTLVELGAVHCDADPLVHRMYDPGKPAFYRIVEIFGEEIVGPDGYIDRKVLGAKVFGKPEEMGRLTRAIGNIAAEVKRVIDEWRETLPREAVAVMEAVNLIEARYLAWCDQTWLVATERENALARLMARNELSQAEAEQRLNSQRPWELREPASDRVFHNDGTLAELVTAVKEAHRTTLAAYLRGDLPPRKFDAWAAEMAGRGGPGRS